MFDLMTHSHRTAPGRRRALALRAGIVLALVALVLAAGLSPGCGGSGPTTPTVPQQTSPVESSASFKFIVCGDPQNQYEVFDKVLAAARDVDFLIIAGDLTGSGTATEFENFVSHMKASGVKYYCIPGNHDVATSPVQENYTRYVGQPHGSFDYENSHFILIDNSTPSLGFYPSEREWAAADLRAARSRGFEHSFAVVHVPPGYPYSAQASKDQIAGMDANELLEPVLSKGGVEELFCGHVHSYDKSKDGNLTVTITGGAGAPLLGAGSYHNYVLVEVNGRRVSQNVVRI